MFGVLQIISVAILAAECHSDNTIKKSDEDSDLKTIKDQLDKALVKIQEFHEFRETMQLEHNKLKNLYLEERNQRVITENKLNELQNQCCHDKREIEPRGVRPNRASGAVFAFHAFLSHPITQMSANQTIVFDQVTMNSINQYSNSTGVFTCIVGGTYFFTWSTAANGENQMAQTFLIHQGQWKGSQVTYNGFISTSSSVILYLRNRDRVWIEAEDHSSLTQEMTTFSGFLLG